ncbi:hypothetical protein QQS21_011009 [Conoideocrella luteorostrata]|uniref:Uncharacterized protein n=1 Tax=Conoideocrella luteorostrata TaxID=1105319 RepID=A0AAJ0CIE0_9HYPO|nr:hypothetical protein QQS21_011009 [Conoideocrella luteorostrata]
MERRVKFPSCGLAEVVPSARHRVVQFIHPSIKDFVIDKALRVLGNFSEMADDSSSIFTGEIAHFRFYKLYFLYLQMEEICQPTSHEDNLESTFPLLDYATASWSLHLRESQVVIARNGDLQVELRDCFASPSEALLQLWIKKYSAILDTPSTVCFKE